MGVQPKTGGGRSGFKKAGGIKKTSSKAGEAKLKPKRQKAHVLRALKEREPKLVENTKKLLLLRGNKTSSVMTSVLKDLRLLKAPDSIMFGRKNDSLHPFEDETKVEFLTSKNDTSLFMIGSSTKKRPSNLIFGRTFDSHILDMLELGVENYKSMDSFKGVSKKAFGSKPAFIFSGTAWEASDVHSKLKSLLIDTFRGPVPPANMTSMINLKGIDHVIACTAPENSANRVLFRVYSINYASSSSKSPRVELALSGPSMDLTFRRNKMASHDLMKLACKTPKCLKTKKQKNVTRDALTADKVGRVHLDHQDLNDMQVRRVKALRTTPKELKSAK